MKNAAPLGVIAAIVVILIIALASAFTVEQTEQAIVLRFGEPVAGRGLVTTPGLHFKYPFIENVVFLDNRILVVEAPKQEVLASDNNRLDVDSFLRYRIVDPLKFYQTVRSPDLANGQLGFILNSAVRQVLGKAIMTEIVRDNRADLMVKIREQVNQEGGNLGIAAVDVKSAVPICLDRFRKRFSAGCRASGRERPRNIALKAPKPRKQSQQQPTVMSSCFAATRSAKPTRPGVKAMRKETAFSPRPTARTLISLPSIARCKPMKPG